MIVVELVQDTEWEIGWTETDVSKFVRLTRVMFDGVNKIPFQHTVVYSNDTNLPAAVDTVETTVQDAIDAYTS